MARQLAHCILTTAMLGMAACSTSSTYRESLPWDSAAHDPERPHHLSVLAAGTHTEDDDDAATVGIDYEYRVNDILGIGTVVEHAFEPLQATTLLAVADIHIWRGFAVQTGPGAVTSDEEDFFVYRFGALYEFGTRRRLHRVPAAALRLLG